MIIKLQYNKTEKTLEVSNDYPECPVIINPNATVDDNDNLSIEISVNTSYLAEIQSDLDGGINE
jgi:hypothetical protein|tara:strand:- start:482 stop:673 length:192 start_codon:yes stop_codon:yes gene_type:complete